MSKRNKLIIETQESRALKSLREKSDLSLRKMADLMDISFTRVHQLETGREEVKKDYIDKFLKIIGLNHDDWVLETTGVSKRKIYFRDAPKVVHPLEIEDVRIECIKILSKLNQSKLKLALELLTNIS